MRKATWNCGVSRKQYILPSPSVMHNLSLRLHCIANNIRAFVGFRHVHIATYILYNNTGSYIWDWTQTANSSRHGIRKSKQRGIPNGPKMGIILKGEIMAYLSSIALVMFLQQSGKIIQSKTAQGTKKCWYFSPVRDIRGGLQELNSVRSSVIINSENLWTRFLV